MAERRNPPPSRAVDQFSITDSMMIQDFPEGTKIRLRAGGVAEVIGNPRDGAWIFIRYLEHPEDPSKIGSEDLAFCTDVVGLV
ncbi:MAG: hypothetical protein GEU73_05390 [Chloroflexi bacterium]|nr:hypothetical protein [Chloroflexota bacterium]